MAKKTIKHKKPNTQNLIMGAVIIVLLGVMGWAAYNMPSKDSMELKKQTDYRAELINGATVTVPEVTPATEVTLTGDTTSYGDNMVDPYKPFGTVTVLKNVYPLEDALIAILAINTGGSGEMFYLSAFEKANGTWNLTSYEPIGDRVVIETLAVMDNTVELSYKYHAEDQAMVDAPSLSKTVVYTYENNMFVEE